MKIILGLIIFLAAQTLLATECQEMIRRLDPHASPTSPTTEIGKLKISIISSGSPKDKSCSISISNLVKNRTYIISDDGSIGISDRVNNTGRDSLDTRFKSYMLLPQEKGKDFLISKSGNLITVHMHSGDFVFDTDKGKIVSGSQMSIEDSLSGLKVTNSKGLWVDFGTSMGKDPKAVDGQAASVSNEGRSCQFKKAGMMKRINKWDQVIGLETQKQQLEFFKKECPGTRFVIQDKQLQTQSPARAFEQAFGGGIR